MKVGFWLDWNSNVQEEMEVHSRFLELALDRPIHTTLIKEPQDVSQFDGDLLTFDYGGITMGYGPNTIVPVLLRAVREWCENNPDRLALLWCTFDPSWYLDDFDYYGGVPDNLRTYHRHNREHVEAELKKHYAGLS